MLTEQRYEIILGLLREKNSVTVTELKDILDASESTVRRDITALYKAGKLTRVFGGAVALEHTVNAYEPTVAQKVELNIAAALIRPEDFVYLDAGTTTGYMLEHLEGSGATFVTNGVSHARALAQMGVRVLLIGGELKGSTEAVIGSQAMQMLKNYHFTKGFFGTNGMTQREGFTTPESNEALVKRTAMEQCLEKYVVSDSSKFGQISAVTFFSFDGAVILTESCSKEYKDCRNIQIVS